MEEGITPQRFAELYKRFHRGALRDVLDELILRDRAIFHDVGDDSPSAYVTNPSGYVVKIHRLTDEDGDFSIEPGGR